MKKRVVQTQNGVASGHTILRLHNSLLTAPAPMEQTCQASFNIPAQLDALVAQPLRAELPPRPPLHGELSALMTLINGNWYQ